MAAATARGTFAAPPCRAADSGGWEKGRGSTSSSEIGGVVHSCEEQGRRRWRLWGCCCGGTAFALDVGGGWIAVRPDGPVKQAFRGRAEGAAAVDDAADMFGKATAPRSQCQRQRRRRLPERGMTPARSRRQGRPLTAIRCHRRKSGALSGQTGGRRCATPSRRWCRCRDAEVIPAGPGGRKEGMGGKDRGNDSSVGKGSTAGRSSSSARVRGDRGHAEAGRLRALSIETVPAADGPDLC